MSDEGDGPSALETTGKVAGAIVKFILYGILGIVILFVVTFGLCVLSGVVGSHH